MDETTIEGTTQQLTELRAKIEDSQTSPAIENVPIDLEKTPEFEAWKQEKIRGSLNYLRENWGMEIAIENLLMREDILGFPDPKNKRAYAVVWGHNYVDTATGEIIVNPMTGRQMIYRIWRKIDTPVVDAGIN